MLELPLVVRSTKEKDHVLKAQCYVIAEDMTFSVENITIENWVSILDTRNSLLKTSIRGDERNFRMITTDTGHYRVVLETLNCRDGEIIWRTHEMI